jgi:predicted Zn-dependent protease
MNDQAVRDYLDCTPMRAILGIPGELLDQAMGLAYVTYRAGRYAETEVLCKGLLAADHRYWWAYSLYGATLLELGRPDDALAQIDRGLRYEPGQSKLLAMRAAIVGQPARPHRSDEAAARQEVR